ncbi:MAG: hypothetical protein KC912_05810 [Proteobacteria bacterium]|nr:hypothetical protein [Pseudomonadota bacterium]
MLELIAAFAFLLQLGASAYAGARLSPERHADGRFFGAVLMAVGGHHFCLHFLVATTGLGLVSMTLTSLLCGAASVWAAHKLVPDPEPVAEVPVIAIPGLVVGVGMVLNWLRIGLQDDVVQGVDATYYHAPNAVNFSLGQTFWTTSPTEHILPVSGPLHGGFLLAMTDSLLILDWMNVLPWLLAFAAGVATFRTASGVSGLTWFTPAFVAFSCVPTVATSLLPSADLWHSATVAATFAALAPVLVELKLTPVRLLQISVAAGLAFGAKSFGLILLVLGVAALVPFVFWFRPKLELGKRPGVALAAGVLLFIGCGGIWPFRAWVLFNSPLPPLGLTIFGVEIFTGASADAMAIKTLGADLKGDFWGTLAAAPGQLAFRLGPLWPVPFFGLPVAVATWLKGDRNVARWRVLGYFVVAAALSEFIYLRTPWTSLHWQEARNIRYQLPLILTAFPVLMSLYAVHGVPEERQRQTLPWALGALWAVSFGSILAVDSTFWPELRPGVWASAVLLVVAIAPASVPLRRVGLAASSLWLVAGAVQVQQLDRAQQKVARERHAAAAEAFCAHGAVGKRDAGAREVGLTWHQLQTQDCERRRVYATHRFVRPLLVLQPDQHVEFIDLVLDEQQRAARVAGLAFDPMCDMVISSREDEQVDLSDLLTGAPDPIPVVASLTEFGVATLEPLREHGCFVPTEPEPGDPISFSRGSRGVPFLGEGWHHAEGSGVWGSGLVQKLRLPGELLGSGSTRIVLAARAMSRGQGQRVRVYAGGLFLTELNVAEPQREYTLTLPDRHEASDLDLSFVVEEAASMKQLGRGSGERILGLWLASLRVEPGS